MKVFRILLPLLCTLLGFFCACGHKPYPHPLIVADSLANACPDSAIALPDALKPRMSHEDEAAQMYYRLLCIKANDKAYIPPHVGQPDTARATLLHRERRQTPPAGSLLLCRAGIS